MQRYLLQLFLAQFLVFSLVHHVHAEYSLINTCSKFLTKKLDTEKLTFWQSRFREAAEKDDFQLGSYATAKMGLLSAEKIGLNLRERGALRHFIRQIEVNYYEKASSESGYAKKALTKFLSFLGLESLLPNKDLADNDKNHFTGVRTASKNMASHLLWTLGPSLFRLPITIFWDKIAHTKSFASAIDKIYEYQLQNQVFNENESEYYAYLQLDLKNYVPTTNLISNAGKALIPLFATVALTSLGYNPYLHAKHLTVSQVEPFKSHDWDSYMQQTERAMNIKYGEQKVLVIYSNEVFSQIDSIPDLTDGFHQMIKLRKKAKDFVPIRAKGFADIKRALRAHNDADTVIILAHGQPDNFIINGEQFKYHADHQDWPQMKEGANLIFVSCLVGRKGSEDVYNERWVRFSDKLLNKGMSVTSTDSISFAKFAIADQRTKGQKNTEAFQKSFYLSIGVYQLFDIILNTTGMTTNKHYWQPNSIRIFDDTDKTVTRIEESK